MAKVSDRGNGRKLLATREADANYLSKNSLQDEQEAPRLLVPSLSNNRGNQRYSNEQSSVTMPHAEENGTSSFFMKLKKQKSISGTERATERKNDDLTTDAPSGPEDPWSPGEVKKTSRLWNLSAKEEEHLVLLGKRLSDISHWKNTPSDAVRFMEARSKSLDAAEKMFRDMIKWRLDNMVDTILQDYEPPRLIRDYIPGAILVGCDRQGDPVYAERIGSADTPEMVRRFGPEHLIKHAIWMREKMTRGDWIRDYEQRTGRPVKQILVVEDLKGLSSAHLNRQLLTAFQAITRLDQDNYPETAKTIVNINAPLIFRLAWSLVKHFFDPNVASKMVFVGPSNTESVLENYIDLSVLPKEFVSAGKGRAAPGLPPNFTGGPLPPAGTENFFVSFDKAKDTVSDSASVVSVNSGVSRPDSVSSSLSSKSMSLRSYLREKQREKEQRKEVEIQGIREIAARRIRPKERTDAQKERLIELSTAKTRRTGNSTDLDQGATQQKSLSERATGLLQRHDRKTRFLVMSFLLSLLFALLHPQLILSALGLSLVKEESSQFLRIVVSQDIGLVVYTLICGIVHFLTCDIALIYAFNALNVGAKAGATIRNYYKENVRTGVAVVSLGIYALSLVKAVSRGVLTYGFAHAPVSPTSPIHWLASKVGEVFKVFDSDEQTCLREEGGSIRAPIVCLVQELAFSELAVRGSSYMFPRLGQGNVVEPVVTSWQLDFFETAKTFYTYTAVFLLVFLSLFNLTARWALQDSTPRQPINAEPVDSENAISLQVPNPVTADPGPKPSLNIEVPPTPTEGNMAVSRSSSTRTMRRNRLRLFRRRHEKIRLSVVEEIGETSERIE